MYKASISNLKNRNIKQFTIKDLTKDKNRYNMVLEPANFSKKQNGFCINELGPMSSQKNLINLFKSNSILQYNKNSNKYYIISPFKYDMEYTANREVNCGIDLGIRTMATVYSPNEVLEIGTNILPTIDKYNKKMDKIKSDKDLKILSDIKYNKILYKYGSKMRNRIDDLHKKISEFLVTRFENIHLGKISMIQIMTKLKFCHYFILG